MAEGLRFERLNGVSVDEDRLPAGGWMAVDLGALPAGPRARSTPSTGRDGNVLAFPGRPGQERARRIPDADIVLVDVAPAQVPEPQPAAVEPPPVRRPNVLRIVLIILLAMAIGWNIVLRRDMWATSITIPIPDNPSHQLA